MDGGELPRRLEEIRARQPGVCTSAAISTDTPTESVGLDEQAADAEAAERRLRMREGTGLQKLGVRDSRRARPWQHRVRRVVAVERHLQRPGLWYAMGRPLDSASLRRTRGTAPALRTPNRAGPHDHDLRLGASIPADACAAPRPGGRMSSTVTPRRPGEGLGNRGPMTRAPGRPRAPAECTLFLFALGDAAVLPLTTPEECP